MALPEPRIDGSVPVPGVERVAFFDEIGGLLSEARFLDLCAGTGMMGLEAVSRGAMSVAFVDRKSRRCGQVGRNVLAMEIRTGRCEIFEEEAEPFLKRMSRRRRFWDVVFWDPPFEADYEEGFRFFGNGSVLRPRGAIAVRHHEEMFFSNVIGVLTRRTMIRFEGAALSIYDRMS